jgi:hypothetical protein
MTRRWLALGVLSLGVMVIGVDGTVLAVATPFITKDLESTATQVLWIGDIYSFVLAACSSQWAASATAPATRSCCCAANGFRCHVRGDCTRFDA